MTTATYEIRKGLLNRVKVLELERLNDGCNPYRSHTIANQRLLLVHDLIEDGIITEREEFFPEYQMTLTILTIPVIQEF